MLPEDGKSAPVTVTGTPPAIGPMFGDTEMILGCGVRCNATPSAVKSTPFAENSTATVPANATITQGNTSTSVTVTGVAPGTYKLGNPNAHPYSTIDHVLKDIKRRSAKVANVAKIVPWYQDFTLGTPHYYAEQVRAQMKAGYDNGFQSWILWNPKSNYTIAALEPRS